MSDAKCGAATPHGTLLEQIMDSTQPKNEREWAARREIESLRQQLSDCQREHKELFDGNYALVQELSALKQSQGEPVAWVREFWYQETPENIPELEREYFSSQVDGSVPLYTAPAIPEGWKIVPIEPTEEMIVAAWNEDQYKDQDAEWADIYKAMLAAAPKPKDVK